MTIIIGERYGKLKIVNIFKKNKTKCFEAVCDCGNQYTSTFTNLNTKIRKNNIPSCGCMKSFNITNKLIGKPSPKKKLFDESEIKDIIYSHENNISARIIGDKYNVSQNVITRLLKSYGYKPSRRRYHHDEDIFETIDTEEKAYWLGFLSADGTIRLNHTNEKKKRGSSIVLKISIKDEHHLNKFNEFFGGNSKIQYGRDHTITRKGNKSYSDYCRISINSNKTVVDIIDKGVTPRKTFTISKPNIPDHLINHFLRGLFDGDGCVFTKRNRLSYSIATASDNMANFLISHLDSLNIKMRRYGINCVINVKQDSILFYNYIYNNATVWLERKRDSVQNILQTKPRKYWTKNDINTIIQNYNKMSIIDLSNLVDGTPKQISSKISKLKSNKIIP